VISDRALLVPFHPEGEFSRVAAWGFQES